MENFKIKATTETASEIIDLLEANGGELVVTKEQLICEVKDGFNILVDRGNGIFSTKGNYPVKEITLPQLRDMVVLKRKPMKEYLNPNQNYELVLCAEKDKEEGFIEVPEGAMFAWKLENGGIFFTGLGMGYRDASVVWHRHTQPEALPFLDDEPSLNDQYAEIEKVRQHNHYFKDVSNLNEIDVYTVLKLFNVTDPCLQHIAKKALCAGQRGHKNFKHDLRDILYTAKRAVEINNG